MITQRHHIGTAARLLMIALAAALVTGCRGDRSDKPPRQFFPDMDDQPKVDAQDASTFFADGRAMREPVPGTVPAGRHIHTTAFAGIDFANKSEYVRPDEIVATGRSVALGPGGAPRTDEAGAIVYTYAEFIPAAIDVDEELLALGQKKYNIYCLPCHGGTGLGDGAVGQRWSYPLPLFNAEIYQRGGEKGQDGYLFHSIRNGVANPGGPYPLRMPAYARKLSIEETWAVVAYLRALQTHLGGSPDLLPERQRLELERDRAAAPSAAGADDALARVDTEQAR